MLLLNDLRTQVNHVNFFRQTALHIACFYGDIKVVQALLQHPNIISNLTDIDGKTPLDIARAKGNSSIVELLEKKAAEKEDVEVRRLLI